MKYWTMTCGMNRSKDFIKGVIAGVTAFAVCKDGKQLVGTMQVPLEIEIAEIKHELGWKREWDYQKCTACDGTGKNPNTDWNEGCMNCDGTGVVEK